MLEGEEHMARSIDADVSSENLDRHTRAISRWVRLSGTEDERHAFDYVRTELESYGYAVNQYESEALIGYPGVSSLEVLSPDSIDISCNGYSLSPATSPDGIQGDLVYVGNGMAIDYIDQDVAGKIVLSDGLAMPAKTVAATRAGAIGHIHINDTLIHEMCISPVWGTAVPATKDLLPSLPSVGVTQADGDQLKQSLSRAPVQIRLVTQPYREWQLIPTLTADLPGQQEDRFVLFSGHIDSWHYGAMDNGTANATQIEVARLLADHRESLRRGVRLAFWSGHSHGRYAGSAWYADQYWQELHDKCVCHVNIDSVGARGADVLEEAPTMAETYDFARDVLRDITSVELTYKRISRSGDQSFWGHGIPSIFISLSEQAIDDSPTAKAMGQFLGSGSRGGGLGWWWHTTQDTIDKIDAANLLRDARVYAETLWRLCTKEYLPLNYASAANELLEAVSRYEEMSEARFDLSRTTRLATTLVERLKSINIERFTPENANTFLMDLGRILIPINYTKEGPFSQDLALGSAALPGFSDLNGLAESALDTDTVRFLSVQLVRERNRVEHALYEALRRIDRLEASVMATH
jgi:hypothetical protein